MSTLIRGDTWRIECVHGREVNGVFTAETIAGLTIASQMRLGAQSVSLTVVDRESQDGTGRFWLTAAASATAVTAGVWSIDIETTNAGVVRSTRVGEITVAQDVTNAN